MAANEKQLEKVTLTLTDKMAGSRGPRSVCPAAERQKFQLNDRKHQFTPNIAGKHTHPPTSSAADLPHIQSHPASLVSMATDFNLINWVENCETDARSISGLIPSLSFAGMYRAFHELLEVYQITVKLTHTHSLYVYLSL